VAHACNPSYLGDRDQEDYGSKPDWENGLQDPILNKTNTKSRAGGVAQVIERLPSKYEVLNSNPVHHPTHTKPLKFSSLLPGIKSRLLSLGFFFFFPVAGPYTCYANALPLSYTSRSFYFLIVLKASCLLGRHSST
jgi:hypothetical protein